MSAENFLRDLPDDGLFLPEIKPHSFGKIQLHNYFARLFTSSMKSKWPQRAYVGLYSGAGRARVVGTSEIIETTAMSVFRLPDPFTKYVFVDSDERCAAALDARISALPGKHDFTIVHKDVNEAVADVRSALPSYSASHGLLSFCFVDPFAANLRFETLRALGTLRMDFLILLMFGLDARLNFRQYFGNRDDTRIADLIACPDWREEYERSSDRNVVRFLTSKSDQAMRGMDYRPAQPSDYHTVTSAGGTVMQYLLAFYSKPELGQKLWQETV